MTKVNGKGQLIHHFWGEYFGEIWIDFKNEEAARAAFLVLKSKGEKWVQGEKEPSLVGWSGNSEELNLAKKILVSFGAEESKIDSMKYSIDCGEIWNVEIPVVSERQLAFQF